MTKSLPQESAPRKPKYNILSTNGLQLRIIPELANEIGLEQSIILLQLDYWLTNQPEQLPGHPGPWLHISARQIARRTGLEWSARKVQRELRNLTNNPSGPLITILTPRPYETPWITLNYTLIARLPGIKLKKLAPAPQPKKRLIYGRRMFHDNRHYRLILRFHPSDKNDAPASNLSHPFDKNDAPPATNLSHPFDKNDARDYIYKDSLEESDQDSFEERESAHQPQPPNSPTLETKMIDNLAQVCHLNPTLKKAQLTAQARILIHAGYTPDSLEILNFWWYKFSWFAQKGSPTPPYLTQIATYIQAAVQSDEGQIYLTMRQNGLDPYNKDHWETSKKYITNNSLAEMAAWILQRYPIEEDIES